MKTSQVALKEWDVVVRALREGRQSLLLRKGGISDANGTFTLKEKEFFLFPTWEHQTASHLNAAAVPEFERSAQARRPDGKIAIDTFAEVESVHVVKDPSELADLPSKTIWSQAYIDQRLSYKPEKPLYLVTLKIRRLSTPHLIADDASYAGCVSWVPLKEPLAVTA